MVAYPSRDELISMAYLTLFSTPKPFTNTHISTIQRNAIQSWIALGSEVEVVLIGSEFGLMEIANEFGVKHLPNVLTNTYGTPLISSIFTLARNINHSPYLAYINADIIVLSGLLEGISNISKSLPEFLIVGQRWDLDIQHKLDFNIDWQKELTSLLSLKGKLHPAAGSDYFVFPRACFTEIPPFAVGRAGWDNWMIFHARKQGCSVVDATQSIKIVHQNHDYSHLPDGQIHYRLPESKENLNLAGGERTIFTLMDASHNLIKGKIHKKKLDWAKFWREVEIFPVINTDSKLLMSIFHALVNPCKAFTRLKTWIKRFLVRKV
jgi:hypothetical protein